MARTIGSNGKETEKRVLKEALTLFAHHGYAAVSMRQIAGQCNIQAGALYNYFPTKQSILHGLMLAHMNDLLSALNAQPKVDDPASALKSFTQFHIRYHIDKPAEVFIAYMELRNLEPEPYAEIMKLRQEYERFLRGILRQGQANGDFQIDDVPVTTMAIISMMTGVNTWYRYGGRLGVEEIEKIYVNLVLSVVGLEAERLAPKLEEIA
jgi:AcrR family transcriptional regulator